MYRTQKKKITKCGILFVFDAERINMGEESDSNNTAQLSTLADV